MACRRPPVSSRSFLLLSAVEPQIDIKHNTPGLTDVPGFRVNATGCNIRGTDPDRLDLGIVASREPCAAAGVFTQNDVCAAPVQVCRDRLKLSREPRYYGLVVNSGNANACTGKKGYEDARRMAALAASTCGVPESGFFVASTGRIGVPLPMDRIIDGIATCGRNLERDSAFGHAFAESILTSDTRTKTVTASVTLGSKQFTVAGVAKGAGMIQPNMATMLAFLATDIRIGPSTLQGILNSSVNASFNQISIDGDMSTNDTVLIFANGASGQVAEDDATLLDAFRQAVLKICRDLSEMIVGDGEKIEHVIDLRVEGARDAEKAEAVARAIANSLLVKTSWYGNDPNWGRLIDAAGYAGAGIDPDKVDLHYDDCVVLRQGLPVLENKPQWKQAVSNRRFSITLSLNQGNGSARVLTTDLTEAYVNYNKSE